MSISFNELLLGIAIAVLLAGSLAFLFWKQRKEVKQQIKEKGENTGINTKQMKFLLTQSIKQEFEHNITQQIYVSPESWDAVRNFKEQNMLIINQVASFLPEEATGMDLNKSLLELIMQNPKTSLQNVVADALSYEAKKVMR